MMDENIVSYFNAQVLLHRNNVALYSEEASMTYGELDELSTNIAEEICGICGENEKFIGVCLERSFCLIASILGVLKAGKAYVPLDPHYPIERISYYCKEANIETTICSLETNDFSFEKKIYVEKVGEKKQRNNNLSEIIYKGNDLAYVLFTSGSTGTPKGVKVTNEAILNTLKWRIKYYNLIEEDIVLQIPSVSFSSSVEDIFCTLLSGGKLCLINAKDLLNVRKLGHMISKFHVTHFLMVPSLYRKLIGNIKENDLKFIVLAGESVEKDLVDLHYQLFPKVKLYVEYGMTETCVGCTAAQLLPGQEEHLIGHMIDNMYGDILNKDENGIGEFVVYGVGIADGYLGKEEGKFLDYRGRKAFLTGDYVRSAENNQYVYVSRRDNQVKVNGQRVNLSEIDQSIKEVEGVNNSITIVIATDMGEKIISFVEGMNLESQVIKKALLSKLPKFFLPFKIITYDEFKYLPNGKIDLMVMKKDFIEKEKK